LLNGDGVITAYANQTTTTTATATTVITSTSVGTNSVSGTTIPASVPATATSNVSSSATQSNDNTGLHTPAKVGLGVGVSLGILFLASLVLLGWFVRQRRRKHDGVTSLPDIKRTWIRRPAELPAYAGSNVVIELAADDIPERRAYR
jgi:hypothetical protein